MKNKKLLYEDKAFGHLCQTLRKRDEEIAELRAALAKAGRIVGELEVKIRLGDRIIADLMAIRKANSDALRAAAPPPGLETFLCTRKEQAELEKIFKLPPKEGKE
jgi:hypothetical protein